MIGVRTMLLAVLMGGAAAEAAPPPRQPPGPVDLLPLLGVRREAIAERAESPVGGYVRLWVERVESDADGARDYRHERRVWLSRWLVGRSRSRILQARVTVTNPNVSASYTLAATSQTSNRTDGENFTSELGQRRFLTPYVRIDPGTTLGIEVSLSASATINPDITGNVLSVIQRGARLAAPTGSLVTALNAERFRETANFVDQSIANLFGEKLSERSLTDFSADQLGAPPQNRTEGRRLATVTAMFPMGSDVWTDGGNRAVGEWQIRVSEPVVSIFSTLPLLPQPGQQSTASCNDALALRTASESQACRAFIGLAPTTVFGFRMGENITLGESLRGDAGITSALARYKDSADDEQAAIALCNLVAGRAEALGLNRFDAAAAVWAFALLGDLKRTVAVKMVSQVCMAGDLGRRLGLSVPTLAADPPPAAPRAAPPPKT